MTKKESLQIKAQNIKMVEGRILDLEKDIKLECDMRIISLKRHSLKVNRQMLKELKEDYFQESK